MATSIIQAKIITQEEAPNPVSCTTSTWKSATSVTLSVGKWLVIYGGAFASNSTGHRRIHFGTSTSAGRYSPTMNAVNGEQSRMNASTLQSVSSETTYSLYAWQNSGGSLDFFGYIKAIKLA